MKKNLYYELESQITQLEKEIENKKEIISKPLKLWYSYHSRILDILKTARNGVEDKKEKIKFCIKLSNDLNEEYTKKISKI